jgi:S-DNA-T family DNA segregation ATPase FtsK/SpoIIIE
VPAPEVKGDSSLPPLAILDEIQSGPGVDHEILYERGRILQAKCGEFGVLGSVKEIHPGPVVTTYEFKPDAGVKYSKIVTLADDLALALEAESIRIDRVSGKGNVGIELPNDTRETIYLREILESDSFRKAPGRLTLALGKTVGGDPFVTDLAAMPHLLIAGSTGTGKSVGLNCMISSILYKSTPDEVRLILIDPKRLELGVYEDIPHLLTPVVTDAKVASNVLKWAVAEMEKRIRKLASEGVRNIEQFNNIIRAERATAEGEEELHPLHYIVIVIDELADLMMVSSHEVEESITRLAQMARAVGIHLILATQRPSVDVLTGLIKANFPSRISYRVAARVDSRTILDSIGAEHLLGRGDMLFLPPGSARLTRIHGAFVTEQEVARLTAYLRKAARPLYDESVGKPERAAEAAEVLDRDDLFDEAVRFVVQSGQASTSMLQRRFRIGFSRAGRLVDLMERDGIVGPADGSKPREILVAPDYYETVDSWPK